MRRECTGTSVHYEQTVIKPYHIVLGAQVQRAGRVRVLGGAAHQGLTHISALVQLERLRCVQMG